MATNDFLPYAVGGGANVLTQSAYAALTTLLANGLQSGIVSSNQLNKTLRQPTIMAAVIGQLIADAAGQNAVDDGTIAALERNLANVIRGYAAYSADTGAANSYVLTLSPVPTAYFTGMVVCFVPANSNTGASGINVNGIGLKDLRKANTVQLNAGDVVSGSVAVAVYNGTRFILINPAYAGVLLNVQVFTSSGTYTPTPGTNSVMVEVLGGGGAGGGAVAQSSSQTNGGGGGGSGAYGRSRITSGFSGATVTIGAGGTGVSGANGNNGGSSSFGALVSAPGGVGGSVGLASASFPITVSGGQGGSVSTGGSIENSTGARGDTAIVTIVNFGSPAAGASSRLGGGAIAIPNNATSPGNAATTKGAGGGGAFVIASGAAQAGGAGAAGLVIVHEFS
jgi:hypothetical protein